VRLTVRRTILWLGTFLLTAGPVLAQCTDCDGDGYAWPAAEQRTEPPENENPDRSGDRGS